MKTIVAIILVAIILASTFPVVAQPEYRLFIPFLHKPCIADFDVPQGHYCKNGFDFIYDPYTFP